ncbi:MAG TPA: hypothetical protein ENN67_09010, partial [Firmicutes bacterium]|nr:hypothetical protein [Bacillota bacterium]
MYCPDCGRLSKGDDEFCPSCGYPLSELIERLKKEEEDKLGWAEKIAGKPKFAVKPPPEPPLATFAPIPEPPAEPVKTARTCDMCGAEVKYGAMCQHCGDKLPGLMESDPFLYFTFNGIWRMFFTPKFFASNFPYPVTGGTTQPLLYPGIFAALFIFSIPLAYADKWLDRPDNPLPMIVGVTGFIMSIIFTPVLVYLSAGLIHIVAKALGRNLVFKRTLRVFASVVSGVLVIGLVINLIRFALIYFELDISATTLTDIIEPHEFLPDIFDRKEFVHAILLIAGAWLYSWMFGGLYRFAWW